MALAVFGLVLGLADLGIGLGTEANPAPYGRLDGGPAVIVDGNGNQTTILLDALGQPLQIIDPLGRQTLIERNESGRPIRVTKPSDGIIPGPLPGQQAQAAAAAAGVVVTELDYDLAGNIIERREAAGTQPTRTIASSHYACSPFGAGWSMHGQQRLSFQGGRTPRQAV